MATPVAKPSGVNVLAGDVNGDGRVSSRDRRALRDAYGSARGEPTYTVLADLNGDGRISSRDRRILRGRYGLAATGQGAGANGEDVSAMAGLFGVPAGRAMPTVGARQTHLKLTANRIIQMGGPNTGRLSLLGGSLAKQDQILSH